MIVKILVWLIVIFLSGCLYHLGGGGEWFQKKWPWLPKWLFFTIWRDLGCSALSTFLLVWWFWPLTWIKAIALFLSWGFCYGALTTYWKKKWTDCQWWNWLLHGFGIAMSALPFVLVSHLWLGFCLRIIALSLAMMVIAGKTHSVEIGEGGRGGVIILTLPLLLI